MATEGQGRSGGLLKDKVASEGTQSDTWFRVPSTIVLRLGHFESFGFTDLRGFFLLLDEISMFLFEVIAVWLLMKGRHPGARVLIATTWSGGG